MLGEETTGTTTTVDFGPAIQDAVNQITGLLQANLLLLLSIPVAWAAFRFVKKLIGKIG